MKVRTKKVLLSAVGVVGLGLFSSVDAATFTWDGKPDASGTSADNLLTTPTNWVGDTAAPNFATGNDDMIFGSGAATTNVGVQGSGGLFHSITFTADAPSYTLTLSGTFSNDLGNNVNSTVVDNSPNLQTYNDSFNLKGGGVTLAPTSGGFQQGGDGVEHYFYISGTVSMNLGATYTLDNITNPASNAFSTSTHISRNGSLNVYGAAGTNTIFGSTPTGRMTLNGAAGTAAKSSTDDFFGTANVWSGALRVGNSTALGTGTAYVHGTFPTATASNAANINTGGFEHGFGALELYNNITIGSTIRIDSRIGDVADTDQLINVSGNNTIGLAATPTASGWTSMGGGGHFNIDSLAGSLTILNIPQSSDPGHKNGAVVNNVFTFRGAGNITIGGKLSASSGGNGLVTLRKQGTGILTVSGQSSTYDGGTMIDAGTLLVSSTGSFTSGAGRIHVSSGAALDVSAVTTGLTLGSTQSLSGSGTVYGSVTSNGSTISPGGTDSLSSTDALTVAGSVNTLTLKNDLSSNDASTMQFDLSSNTASGNDAITVGGNLNLAGTTNVLVNPLTGSLGIGTYTLINYAGSLTGTASNLTLTTSGRGITANFDTSTAHQLNLHVSSFAPSANLVWAGGANSNAFDVVTTVNWTGAYDSDNRFYNGDNVTFSTAGANTPSINVIGSPTPASVTFSNSTGHDYTLSGAGAINDLGDFTLTGSGNVTLGNASLNVNGAIKQNGTGTLTYTNTPVTATGGIVINSGNVSINNGAGTTTFSLTVTGTGTLRKDGTGIATLSSNNGAFDGSVLVNTGTLRLTSGNALGTAVGGTTVTSGATLDLFGSDVGTEVVTIAGNGAADQRGALVDTSGLGNHVLSHINQLILADDSTICVQGGAGTFGSYIFVDGNNASVTGGGHNLNLLLDSNCESDWFVGATGLNNINVTGGGGNAGAGGVLYIGGNTDLGKTGTLKLANGAKLGLYGSSFVNTKQIVVDTSGTGVAGIEYDIVDTNVGSINATTLGSPIAANGNLDVWTYKPSLSRALTLSGAISGNGSIGFHTGLTTPPVPPATPPPALYYVTSDDSTCTGTITIGGGGGLNNPLVTNDLVTLSVGNGGTTGSLGTSPIAVGGGSSQNGTLQFDKNGTYTVRNSIYGNGTVTFIASGENVKLTGLDEHAGQTVVQGGTVELSTMSQDSVLSGAANGTDIQKGRIIFDYDNGGTPHANTNIDTVNNAVKMGYNTSKGTQAHFAPISGQIFSTTATAAIGLGVYDNGMTTTVAVAYYGDANLDGTVNALDFNALATNYGGTTNEYWYKGDYNYDGSVDSNDFALLAANFGAALPTSEAIADGEAAPAALGSLVPEPTSLGLLGIAGIIAMRRRARR